MKLACRYEFALWGHSSESTVIHGNATRKTERLVSETSVLAVVCKVFMRTPSPCGSEEACTSWTSSCIYEKEKDLGIKVKDDALLT